MKGLGWAKRAGRFLCDSQVPPTLLQKMLDYLKDKKEVGFFQSIQALMQTCRWALVHILFKKNNVISLSLAVLGLCCCTSVSLVVTSRGYSLVAMRGHLTVVASLVAEHGALGPVGSSSWSTWAQ